jgi:hypothetical protein
MNSTGGIIGHNFIKEQALSSEKLTSSQHMTVNIR